MTGPHQILPESGGCVVTPNVSGDDWPQLQAAVNSYQRVVLATGTFSLGQSLQVPDGATIQGHGWKSILRLANAVNDYAIKLPTATTNRVVFRDFEVDGNNSQQTAGGCVQANNPVQCIFDGLHLHHAYDTALWLNGNQGGQGFGHHNRITDSLFDNSNTSAGNGRALVLQSVDECFISGCDFESNGRAAASEPYQVKDWTGINSFVNCCFVGGGEGIRIQDSSGSRVIGCMFDGVGRDAVHISGSNCQIIGNHFAGNTGTSNSFYHLFLDNGGYNTVSGNVFDSGTVNSALRGFVSHQQSSNHNCATGNSFHVNTGSLGSGGVWDWNGGSAAATLDVVKTNIGLADQ